MRLSTFVLAGLFGGLLLVGDASACHKKKACGCAAPAPVAACAPAPAPARVVTCAPAPAPAVACAPAPARVKHSFKMPKLTFHKKAVAASCAAPATFVAAPAVVPSAQASGQSM